MSLKLGDEERAIRKQALAGRKNGKIPYKRTTKPNAAQNASKGIHKTSVGFSMVMVWRLRWRSRKRALRGVKSLHGYPARERRSRSSSSSSISSRITPIHKADLAARPRTYKLPCRQYSNCTSQAVSNPACMHAYNSHQRRRVQLSLILSEMYMYTAPYAILAQEPSPSSRLPYLLITQASSP